MQGKNRLISSLCAPPPSPIPTGKGSRSVDDSPLLSDYLEKSTKIPELTLPGHIHQSKPPEIDYRSLVLLDEECMNEQLRTAKEFGVLGIQGHDGIMLLIEELRSSLVENEKIFGLQIENCISYGDFEKFIWSHSDEEVMKKMVSDAIGRQNFQILSHKLENIATELSKIAKEIAEVLAQIATNQPARVEGIQLGEQKIIIYRYHQANIVDDIPSLIDQICEESCQFALSLHLLLEPGEFCWRSGHEHSSFHTSAGIIVMTLGKEFEEWSQGQFKSTNYYGDFKPYLQTSQASFSVELKWGISVNSKNAVGKSDKTLSLADQVLVILIIFLWYKALPLFSSVAGSIN